SIEPRPSVGYGRSNSGGEAVHLGAAEIAEESGKRGLPEALVGTNGTEVVGDLGWFAYPSVGRCPRVLGRRRGKAGPFGGDAGIRFRPESIGPRMLAASQTCGNAESLVYGHGGVASGIPFGRRAFAAEAPLDSIVFCRSRVTYSRVKVSFFAQLSVIPLVSAFTKRRKHASTPYALLHQPPGTHSRRLRIAGSAADGETHPRAEKHPLLGGGPGAFLCRHARLRLQRDAVFRQG